MPLELVVSSKYEEICELDMFSEDRSTNDYVDAAVNDLSVQGIECWDYTTVDRASETHSCKEYRRCRCGGVLALARRSLPQLQLDPSNYVPIDKWSGASTSVE